jgi:hypothetical protein
MFPHVTTLTFDVIRKRYVQISPLFKLNNKRQCHPVQHHSSGPKGFDFYGSIMRKQHLGLEYSTSPASYVIGKYPRFGQA